MTMLLAFTPLGPKEIAVYVVVAIVIIIGVVWFVARGRQAP
jgi:hypothetical protein